MSRKFGIIAFSSVSLLLVALIIFPAFAKKTPPSISIEVDVDQLQKLPTEARVFGDHRQGIYATIIITNISDRAVNYEEMAGEMGAAATNKVMLFLDSHRVPFTSEGEDIYLNPSNPQPAGRYSYMGDGALRPGESASQQLRIDDIFAIQRPGTYHMIVSRHDPVNPNVVVNSKRVDFEVSK